MIHPETNVCWIGEDIGWGVTATRLIPAGTLVWVRDTLDQCLAAPRWQKLAPRYEAIFHIQTYLDALGNRHLPWDEAQFVNHSCSPNCHGTLYGFDIALKDIAPGEMLTNDYGFFGGVDIDFECRCRTPRCRGSCGAVPSDADAHALTSAMQRAIECIEHVPQPLMMLLSKACLAQARKSSFAIVDHASQPFRQNDTPG